MANNLSGGAFQDSAGNLLANGRLVLTLSAPCTDLATGLIGVCNQYSIVYPLDSSGNVAQSPVVPFIWANNLLQPAGTYYVMTVFSQSGQLSWGPNAIVLKSTTGVEAINLNTIVPANPVSQSSAAASSPGTVATSPISPHPGI